MIIERLRRRHAVPIQRPSESAQQGMTPREIADALAKIEQQARRLRPPLRHEPESFHEDKSELLRLLRLLEAAVRRGLTSAGPLTPCQPGTLHATLIPTRWRGTRWWIVALIGEVVGDAEKLGALKREIVGECL